MNYFDGLQCPIQLVASNGQLCSYTSIRIEHKCLVSGYHTLRKVQ